MRPIYAFLFATACTTNPIVTPDSSLAGLDAVDESGSRVAEGSPAALGMLAFLNHESTTFEVLDDDVGLDRRAAESIIAHRNGPDGELGWLHDDLFDTVAEVDDRYYVGTTALERIEAWALAHDWVAQSSDDILGTWDGVTFTVAEAEATVAFANTASHDLLDHDLGLDSRAVDSIFAARNIGSVQELAGLYYVGKSALTTLKDAAAVPACDAPGWDHQYIYDNGDGAWRTELPAELVTVIDEVVSTDDWCGEATGDAWFVMAMVDRLDCVDQGYVIELGQGMLEYPDISWYIEFEVDQDFGWFHSTCEV